MTSLNQKTQQTRPELGNLLRYWRQQRGKSQLDLSLDAGVSQRHISFVESGRSLPSKQMVLDLTQALDVPLRERNVLLLASGYAPLYQESAWDSPEMAPVKRALDRVLEQHEPHPAVVMDRYWNVLMTNKGAPAFFNSFIDLAARQGPRNILHLMLDPHGMKPFVENWDDVAAGLLQRVYRESVGRTLDEKTKALLEDLRQYPDVRALWEAPAPLLETPVLPIVFLKDKKRLSYFSMISTIGTPQCITAQEFRIECMFPADA